MSQQIKKRHSENRLAYSPVVEKYNFTFDNTAFHDCNILPPLLEKDINLENLETIKGKTCLFRAENDWLAKFMDHEFLAVLKK